MAMTFDPAVEIRDILHLGLPQLLGHEKLCLTGTLELCLLFFHGLQLRLTAACGTKSRAMTTGMS